MEKQEDARASETIGEQHGFLYKMNKKTLRYTHQLLHSAEDEKQGIMPLTWDHFLQVMRAIGFTHEPSVSGSSVRFDPPNSRDPPITFHKPHPDPTLQPHMVRTFAKRLKSQYGLSEEDFYAAGSSG